MSNPANGGDRCLRCGYEFEDAATDSQIVAFCSSCVQPELCETLTINIVAEARSTSVEFGRGEPSFEVPAPMGTVETPRVALDGNPTYGEHFLVRTRTNEHAVARLGPLHVRINAKMGKQGERPSIKINIDLNLWSSTRQQYEDRLVWADRVHDEYLEILTRAGTAEIAWTSGWTSLRAHHTGAQRLKSYELPDISLPIMRRREQAIFAPTYAAEE